MGKRVPEALARPVLIRTRNSPIGVLSSVTVAPIISAIRRIPTEVASASLAWR
jgi:mRNA-degrading endonuclease toxin of MazEF toxin-antitoxin module